MVNYQPPDKNYQCRPDKFYQQALVKFGQPAGPKGLRAGRKPTTARRRRARRAKRRAALQRAAQPKAEQSPEFSENSEFRIPCFPDLSGNPENLTPGPEFSIPDRNNSTPTPEC